MKAILIINRSSGKMKRKMPPMLRWTLIKLGRRLAGLSKPKITEDDVIEEVKKKCDKEKIELDIEFTKYPKNATELAKVARDKYDLIIAAGGDGTINEVINGMANSKATLVIIPFGSTNVLACQLGIPDDPPSDRSAELNKFICTKIVGLKSGPSKLHSWNTFARGANTIEPMII